VQEVFDDLRAQGIVAGAAARETQWADWAARRGYTERLERTRFFATLGQAVAAYHAEVVAAEVTAASGSGIAGNS
jgi:hypothetical protein